ncbi:class I SAM-dependent methyltransferase [Candidatus Saccharibacteria bacterium]|nr:class I SAM-dependent methyltransferase [Candidatus Saccharibacteria bacterium]
MDSTDQYWSNLYTSGRDYTLIGTGEIDKIIATVGVGERQKQLDIGCGTGQLTREFYHRGYTVVGIDPSAAAIEKARNATAREGLTYYHGTIDQNTTLLENEGLFDVITCKLVYAFIEDKVTFLQNVNSILSSSGYFILITPLPT